MLLRHLLHNSMLVAACLMLVLSLPALAQRPGGGSPPPGGMPGAGGPGAGGIPATPVANNGAPEAPRADVPSTSSTQQGTTMSTMRGGVQLGPPGRWWDDKHFAKTLHLRPAQQKRMDAIFEENRSTLVSRYQALQQEESKMEALSRGQSLDEATLFAQIDRVSQARTDLEKATTHYMLQVRKEMDADQIARLDKYR